MSEIGSDRLKHKGRSIFPAALAAGALLLFRFGSGEGLRETVFFLGERIESAAAQTLFPTAFMDEDRSMPGAGAVAGMLMDLVEGTLFTQNPVQETSEGVVQQVEEEYYPSDELLEKFARENQDAADQSSDSAETPASSETPRDVTVQADGDTSSAAQGADQDLIPAVATPANGILYPTQSLYDYTFLINNFYITDSSTASDASLINGETLLNRDLTLDLTGEEPVILIYHTHSQEKFADSRDGEIYDTVVGLGNTLTSILQEKYHISVYHDTGIYDMIDGIEDRNEAYSLAGAAVSEILAQNPSIKVVIDLHRDGVSEDTHLVTEVNGKPTAQIMFFNGLCRNANNDTEGYLQNPYLTDNLAFSLQMQIKAAEKYPGFTRRIYLRDYRYNMHLCPRSLLVECGAQTNTVEEAHNAMEPLADLLYCVLSGQ